MATYTADAAQTGIQPRLSADGVTYVKAAYIANGTTISVGDTYQLCKIPHGVSIVDLKYYGRSSGAAATIFDLGISGSLSVFGKMTISSTDQYITSSANNGLPYNVSLSDDAANQYITLLATCTTSASPTNTGTFGVVVAYVRRGTGGGDVGTP